MRKSLLSASLLVGLFILSVSVPPALAAPEWGITIEHHNAYGLQAESCPGGHESLPGEPNCGVDPFTGSGTTFDRESAGNQYAITVKNTGTEVTGGLGAGAVLTCDHGNWNEETSTPSFTYRWLRAGVLIPGAESPTYTLSSEDTGKAIQCQIAGANSGGTTVAVASAVVANPRPVTPVAVDDVRPVEVSGEGEVDAIKTKVSCGAGEWSGAPTFTYQWLRSGSPILGAVSDEYTLTEADSDATIQCQVTATNAGGSVIADNDFPIVGQPEPSEYPAFLEAGVEAMPTIQSAEAPEPVTVSDQLPAGLVLTSPAGTSAASWQPGGTCVIGTHVTSVVCTRSDSLAPGEAYPPIKLRVYVQSQAANPLMDAATVHGGGVTATATADDVTSVAPAVPFGIERFTTNVTDMLGNPFTQASGHPFSASASLELTTTTASEEQTGPAGDARDVEIDLPAGLVGNPQAVPRCPLAAFDTGAVTACPPDTAVGFIDTAQAGTPAGGPTFESTGTANNGIIYNLEPVGGSAADFGVSLTGQAIVLAARLRSDGDYGVDLGDAFTTTPPLLAIRATFCAGGVIGGSAPFSCAPLSPGVTPFLTNPSECAGPAPGTIARVSSWQAPNAFATMDSYAGARSALPAFDGQPESQAVPSAAESFLTGCNLLRFSADIAFNPSSPAEGGTSQADEPTGMTFVLKVPQSTDASATATPDLKKATVTLPEGMTVNPSAADGLQACTNSQFGLNATTEPAEPAVCPLASQIGTVKVITPLLEKPLEGQVFLGAPECSLCTASDAQDGHIFRLFLQVRSVERGLIIKLAGKVSANPSTGRLQATFTEQPQLPFSELLMTFTGGARSALANPQTCGTSTTTADLTPWSTSGLGGPSGAEPIAGTPDATPSSSFNVDWNGAGGACPASLPLSPTFSAGSQTPVAGGSSPFSVTFGRQDREQNLSGLSVATPLGLLGKVSEVQQCPEAQANAGTCGSASQVGTATIAAGAGADPYYLTGNVYLTGPYKGEPFGLSVAVPAEAGPFKLAGNTGNGLEVVRASIAVNPSTAALTITSDSLPQVVDGVPLRLRTVHVEIDRPGFMLNPTSCAQQGVGATIAGAQGASVSVSSPFEVGGCQNLPFSPSLSASTQGKTSKADGASLTITVNSTPGQANIGKVDVQLPKALPARLIPTLQNACTEAQFNLNPANCPVDSLVGTATAVTPILNAPLSGPAILVSHGGAAFPDLEFILQGENGVEIVLDGKTDIKNGITYSKFESVPDAPISSFVTTLSEGPHSILATDIPASAKGSLCGQSLSMPTTITAQNGATISQTTQIAPTGCSTIKIKKAEPLTRAQKLAKALKACRTKKYKAKSKQSKRTKCEKQARKKYGPLHKAKKKAKKSSNRNGKAGR